MVENQRVSLTENGAVLLSEHLGRKVSVGEPGVVSYVPQQPGGWLVTLDNPGLRNPLFRAGYWALDESQVVPII